MIKNKDTVVQRMIVTLALSIILMWLSWSNMAVYVPAATKSGAALPTGWASSDLLSKNGNWRISIDNSGNLRIFQMNAFKPTAGGGPWPMSMLYYDGSGGTSSWGMQFYDTSGSFLGSATNRVGSIIDQNATTLRPTEGSPIFQTRQTTIGGIPITSTAFLEPVNNEKLLLVGLTIANKSTTDTIEVDIRIFMDTMMDINGINYHDDRVPVHLTPSKNAFIARSPTGRVGQNAGGGSSGSAAMVAPGAQYIIYYNNTPNITNADFWWVGAYSPGVSDFWYGYTSGVNPATGYPVAYNGAPQYNQIFADSINTINYPGGSPVYDTAATVWYDNRVIGPGEEVTVKFAVGMSDSNNPPVLETLLPNKPVLINTIKDNTTSMNISGTWYDNDSPYVDIYGVVDGGDPVIYDGGSLNNDPPRYSGPQTGITGPDNRPFSADYDLSSYNDAEWHIVDYYIEDPSQLVSNQKSVRFILYALEPITKGYDYVDDSYTQAILKGSINRASLPASAKIVEVGLVYAVSDGNLPPNSLLDHSNGRGIVSTDWDGNIGSTFSGMAYGLDPALTYHYVSYAKVEWTDPITGEKFYEYVYSEIQPMSTFRLPPDEPTPSPTGSVLNPATESGQSDTIGTDGGIIFGGGSDSSYGNIQLDAGPLPYTASVTMKPTVQPQITDEPVDEGSEEIPVTGYKSIALIMISVGVVAAIIINQSKRTGDSN